MPRIGLSSGSGFRVFELVVPRIQTKSVFVRYECFRESSVESTLDIDNLIFYIVK